MKKLLCTIVLVLICGCGTSAWYQPEKNLEQAVRDCEECRYEVLKYGSGPSQGHIYSHDTEVLIQCMRLRGYSFVDVSALLQNNQVRIREDRPFYTVVGK